MSKKCYFKGCLNFKAKDKNIRFFHFRRHDWLQWAEACKISLEHMSIKTVTSTPIVCEEHFNIEDYDFRARISPLKKSARLLKTAVPKDVGCSISMCPQDQQDDNVQIHTLNDDEWSSKHLAQTAVVDPVTVTGNVESMEAEVIDSAPSEKYNSDQLCPLASGMLDVPPIASARMNEDEVINAGETNNYLVQEKESASGLLDIHPIESLNVEEEDVANADTSSTGVHCADPVEMVVIKEEVMLSPKKDEEFLSTNMPSIKQDIENTSKSNKGSPGTPDNEACGVLDSHPIESLHVEKEDVANADSSSTGSHCADPIEIVVIKEEVMLSPEKDEEFLSTNMPSIREDIKNTSKSNKGSPGAQDNEACGLDNIHQFATNHIKEEVVEINLYKGSQSEITGSSKFLDAASIEGKISDDMFELLDSMEADADNGDDHPGEKGFSDVNEPEPIETVYIKEESDAASCDESWLPLSRNQDEDQGEPAGTAEQCSSNEHLGSVAAAPVEHRPVLDDSAATRKGLFSTAGGRANILKCDKCGFTSAGMPYMAKHLREVHKEFKPYQCGMCPYSTARAINLKKHVDGHGVHKRVTCVHLFTSQDHVRKHVERTHTGTRLYKCPVCTFLARSVPSLKMHLEAGHQNSKRYRCSLCDYFAFSKYDLKVHTVADHSAQRVQNMRLETRSCQICNYSAVCSSSLQKHMESVHARNKRS